MTKSFPYFVGEVEFLKLDQTHNSNNDDDRKHCNRKILEERGKCNEGDDHSENDDNKLQFRVRARLVNGRKDREREREKKKIEISCKIKVGRERKRKMENLTPQQRKKESDEREDFIQNGQ